ncbi:MAG: hypothetical protein H0U52_00490 [Chloroflexi bacterium]|nr:hypothetical protein [Chloroflexota bacterium]
MNPTPDTLDVVDPGTVAIRSRPHRDAAFREPADAHLDQAYGLARAILRDQSEAQDATHDAFVQAWRKWASRPVSPPASSPASLASRRLPRGSPISG